MTTLAEMLEYFFGLVNDFKKNRVIIEWKINNLKDENI
jgi:hypothetical protein